MNLPSNTVKLGGGLAIGLGAVLLAPVVIPLVGTVLRPVAKAAIKGSLVAYEKAKLTAAETFESLEDLAAEAKAELAEAAEPEKPKKAPAKAKKKS